MSSSNFCSFLSIQLFHEKKNDCVREKIIRQIFKKFFSARSNSNLRRKTKRSRSRVSGNCSENKFFPGIFFLSPMLSQVRRSSERPRRRPTPMPTPTPTVQSQTWPTLERLSSFSSTLLNSVFVFVFCFFENCLKNHEETKTCWTSSFDLLTRIWYRCLEAATHPRETRSSTRETDNVGLQDRLVPLNKNLVKWSCHKYSYNSSESEKKNQRSPRWEPKWWLKTPPGLSGFL